MLERSLSELYDWLEHFQELPEEWSGAVLDEELLYLTPTELRELAEQVVDLLAAYRNRTTDPRRRPEGSRPVRALAALFPAAEIDARGA